MSEPDVIWCQYCLADWELLPGEYETLMKNDTPMICPLCGGEMVFVNIKELLDSLDEE